MSSDSDKYSMYNNDSDEYYMYNTNMAEAEPCDSQKADDVYGYISVYVYSIIVVVGLLGNLLVIVTYAFYKKTKSMTDVYLLNVAVADVFFVVVLPLIVFNEQHDWSMGHGACKFLRGAYSINLYSGLLLLGCISGDRYLAIVCANRSRYLRSRTLVYSHAICLVVWVTAILLSLPTFMYSDLYQSNHTTFMFPEIESNSTEQTPINQTTNSPDDYGWYLDYEESEAKEPVLCIPVFDKDNADTMKVVVPSLQMAIGFLLPLVAMAFCYTSIILTLLKARNFQRHKAVRVVLSVVLVFILCHLPYNLMLLVDTVTLKEQRLCAAENAGKIGLHVTQTLAFLHCCLNPFLYAFVGVRFRSHFQKVLRDLWCVSKGYVGARRQSSRLTSEVCLSTRKSIDGSNTDHGTSFTM
ncbi:C-C chemokine receptor type 6-like [Engraulis encrasicolus]|uniref:C-C chemokine receptor type 6-like n=1 Tax=Engraulis encrasicolus TaxID=184585 RepID=UPI002FCFF477